MSGRSYSIWIMKSPYDVEWHTRCFEEVARALQYAFGQLGHTVPVVYDPAQAQGTVITLGGHLLHELSGPLPEDMVLYNFEQVRGNTRHFRPNHPYIDFLRRYPVWDYSQHNIEALQAMGVQNMTLCGVGYAPALTRIESAPQQDIDVLFIGTKHARRQQVLDELERRGARTHYIHNLYGEERDAFIARSKIVLNMHLYPAQLLEIVRVSYLLANRKCVISEPGNDAALEAPLKDGLVWAPYNRLADACMDYLHDDKKRKAQEERGFAAFSALPQAPMLQAALEAFERRKAPAVPEEKALPRIFVFIPSYRDPECQWTVKDLFEKATHPERISVGICWQFDGRKDKACFSVEPPRPDQVRMVKHPLRDSKGANWARAQAFSLWQGEEYALGIDSHMRFEPGWDEALLDMLRQCPHDKSLLTGWLPGYKPPGKLEPDNGTIPLLTIPNFGEDYEFPYFNVYRRYVSAAKLKSTMRPACRLVANCMFGPAAAFAETPFDPYIDFWGDEINQSARLWTRGWDFFQFNRRVMYHHWDPDNIKDRNVYRDRRNPRHTRARQRHMHLFGLQRSEDAAVIAELDTYSLGNERPLEEYWRFIGVDFRMKSISDFAMKGEWGISAPPATAARDPGSHGLRSLVRDDGKAAIFVGIPSFRDTECQWTVKDLFEKAAHPERISVGICWQFDAVEDKACFEIDYPYPKQVRVRQFHYKDAVGIGWARAQAFELWQGEEYALMIDSHMRFEPGWDEALIEMLARCPSERPVISACVPGYKPPGEKQETPGLMVRTRIHALGEPDSPQMLHQARGYAPLTDQERCGLYPAPFTVGNFLFCRAGVLKALPIDPYIQFWGEEITLSARLWTHGYDIFQPDRRVAYHYWRRDELVAQQNYRRLDTPRSRQVQARILHMLGFQQTSDAQALAEIERYGRLGDVRPLADLWRFAGIDWQERRVSKDAQEGIWDMAGLHSMKASGTWQVASDKTGKPATSHLPLATSGNGKIFVNIASYRDSECQWTVKDLFEKAARPERIFVGICWQYDPEEDQHCFQVATRPEQVRVILVDWREAEGVCWARWQTQQLWDGEEYTLMLDSHMRFVPGWDELMIAELAACDSAKPVLSNSPASYVPPDRLSSNMHPTIRRVKPFFPDGNIRGQGEQLDRVPEKPLRGAFIVANFVFSRAGIIQEVPYDPYLYFDQEEVSYAARLYTYGWDVFSTRRQFLYHFYNDKKIPGAPTRPLHWHDLHKEDQKRIQFLRERGMQRFNHLTGHKLSTDPEVLRDIDRYGFGTVRTLAQFEAFTGIDFKRKIASEKAVRALFIADLYKYRDHPVYVPEIDGRHRPKAASAPQPILSIQPQPIIYGAQKLLAGPPRPSRPMPVAATPVKMLEEGDYMPLFELTDSHGKNCSLEVYGGIFLMVFFLSANDPYTEQFLRHLEQQSAQHKHVLWRIAIIDDTPDNLKALRQRTRSSAMLCADPGRRLSQSLGIARPGEAAVPPVGFVLNTNLKVVRRHMRLSPSELASAAIIDAYAQMNASRILNQQEQRIVVETAPALIVPNAFSPELCKKCIDAFHSGHTFEGTVGAENTLGYRPNAKVRTDFIVYGDLLEEIDDKLSRSLFPEIKKVFGFEVTNRELYKIGLYKGEKGGFFKQHRDNFEAPLGYRRVAMTLQLNDDYEGGGLHFPEYDDHIYRPARGSAIAFSCGTLHEARPVTAGERFILVGFFHGDEDEAYRRHHVAAKGKAANAHDFTPKLRHYPVRQGRQFFKDWREQHVHIGAEAAPLAQQPKQSTMLLPMLNGHAARKVLDTPKAIVLDDFLPEELYRQLHRFALSAEYERANTSGRIERLGQVGEGFPLRSVQEFSYRAGSNHPPTGTLIDGFIEQMLAAQPHVEALCGRQAQDWQRLSVTAWMYPPGAGLSLHREAQASGAFFYFLHPLWKAHWGGQLLLPDEEGHRLIQQANGHAVPDELLMEHGFARCILPKKNRAVFIAKDAYHMLTRVNEQAGDNLHMSLAGVFAKP